MLTISQKSGEKSVTGSRAIQNLIFALMLVIFLISNLTHFQVLPYRYDETWIVGASQSPNPITALPPLIRIWVMAFGTTVPITRWLAALIFTLGITFVSRLALAIYGSIVMWLTPLILGSLALILDFGGRATLYALPFMASGALCWLFWAYIQRGRKSYGIAYIISTLVMAISYPLGLSLIVLHFIFAILSSRTRRSQILILPCVALIVGLIGAALMGLLGDNIVLAIDRSLIHFEPSIRLLPTDNVQLLLFIGLAVAGLTIGWQPNAYRTGYLALMMGGILVINLFINAGGIQTNLLALVLPLIIVLAAHGLCLLATPFRVVIVLGYVLLGLNSITANQVEMPPYPQMSAQITTGAGIVIAAPNASQQAASLFYIRQRMPDAAPFHIVGSSQQSDMRFLPVSSSNVASEADPISVQTLVDWAQSYNDIWFIQDGLTTIDASPYAKALKQFTPFRVTNWIGERATEHDLHRMIRFVRVPSDLQNQFDFGDRLSLQKWTLKNDVNVRACQPVTIESWWQLKQPAQANYILSLTLVNTTSGQGIAHEDSALGANETLLWQTNQPYFDERSLTISCDLASGDYPLIFSVYSLQNNAIQSLAAKLPDGSLLGNQIYLTTIHVQGAS